MLSKQSIRKEHTIYVNGVKMSKDEIIDISSSFSELETAHFKKMLQQGGRFKIQGVSYTINREEKMRNSKGGFDTPFKLKDKD
jgi:hypothetical protein